MSHHPHSTGGPDPYEKTDVHFWPVMISLLLLTAFILLGIVLSYVSFAGLEFFMKKSDKPLPPMMQTGVQPPEPRLQVKPADDLALIQKEQQASVNTYAWVDSEAGIAQIPVQRAMQILAERPKIQKPQEGMPKS